MVHPFVTEGVLIGYVYRGPTPINQPLSLVFVCRVELRLASQPKLVTMEKLKSTLHIVEYGIVDVIQRLIQAK